MIENLTKDERKKLLSEVLEEKKKESEIFFDYYLGGGKQWKDKGLVTRSGRDLYDKTDRINSKLLERVKVYEWAELNLIKFAIDEKARITRGIGDVVFKFQDERISNQWEYFWANSGGDSLITEIAKKASIYSFCALGIDFNTQKIRFYDSSKIIIQGEEIIFSYYTKIQDAYSVLGIAYLGTENKQVLYSEVHNINEIIIYIDGEEMNRITHNFGVNDIIIIKNSSICSDIYEDIPYQDDLNIILTRYYEVLKRNLNPLTTIRDDEIKKKLEAAKKANKPAWIDTTPGAKLLLSENGELKIHEWQGLPAGTLELLDKNMKVFMKKKGIAFFEDLKYAESGEAKREARMPLYNASRDLRDNIAIGLNELVKLYFKVYRFDTIVILEFPPLFEVSEKEKREIAMTDFTVHNNKRKYLEDVGYTQEEIDETLNGTEEAMNDEVLTIETQSEENITQ